METYKYNGNSDKSRRVLNYDDRYEGVRNWDFNMYKNIFLGALTIR